MNVTIPTPQAKYKIIYADPPWEYKDKACAGRRGASFKYKTQKREWLERLNVSEIADDNCALFLWTTMPMLPVGIELLQSWGFQYKTVAFVWVKYNKISKSIFWGMGNWTRANPELCLLGVRGKVKRLAKNVHSVITSRIEEHSKKPDETRGRIVSLLGDVPRIELFARKKTIGWDCWGNEIDETVGKS